LALEQDSVRKPLFDQEFGEGLHGPYNSRYFRNSQVSGILYRSRASDASNGNAARTRLVYRNRFKLHVVLKALYGKLDDAALSDFRGLRKRFNEAAKSVDCAVRFLVDTAKRSPPAHRECWFSGPSTLVNKTETFGLEKVDFTRHDLKGLEPAPRAAGQEGWRCLATLRGHKSLILSCAWSPDGQRLVSGSDDDTLRVWDAASGRCLSE
jgi:WD40 repeat protein